MQREKPTAMSQFLAQVFLILVLISVLFPIIWVAAMSLDGRGLSRPLKIPFLDPEFYANISMQAYGEVVQQPSPNPVSFVRLLGNSLLTAGGTSIFAVTVGILAAYAFSRFRFVGRQSGMIGFIVLQMVPAIATLAPLFVLLNAVGLRTQLAGLMIAYASTGVPFAIWNLKGYLDTIPRDLEEAALIDGCTTFQVFTRIILPLAVPALAITALFGFMTGWSEFALAWTFLEDSSRFTLAMVLRQMQGQYASNTPWDQFAAMAILFSIPMIALFFAMQRYIVAGLTAGGVKG
jgi:arabinogalactan oligomer/maltooligosaccharide transport system permease protein